jgi:hypothetical protein
VDSSGNVSTTATVKVVCILYDVLTVRTNGVGTVAPQLNGKLLQLGKTYVLTASPSKAPANVFSNWTGGVSGPSGILTNGATLKFVMQSNLVLQANFIGNPFIAVAGNYAGLFYNTNDDGVTVSNAGYFTATVKPNAKGGAFTGKLRQGAKSYSVSGQFSLTGGWSLPSISGAPGLGAWLQLSLDGGNGITGQISNSVWTAQVMANRAYYSRTLSTPHAGQYTLTIPGSDTPASLPAGHGAAAVNVTSAGAVTVNGVLGDGTIVTESTFVSKDGQWPLYAAPYSKKGIVIGWMTFTNDTVATNDLEGVVSWIKPGGTVTKLYPDGFDWPYSNETNNAFGSSFTNKPPFLTWSNGVAMLNDGNLARSITNGLLIGSAGKVTGTNKLNLTITTTGVKAGLFKGSVVNPATGKAIPVNGALLQKQDAGYGSFLGTNQSGSVMLAP